MINNTNWVEQVNETLDNLDLHGVRNQADFRTIQLFDTRDLFDNI